MTARLARLLDPIVWRLPGHAARKLHSFARAEQGSLIDLTLAARATPCARRAALYLRHAGDESRHASLFARRSTELREARGRHGFGDPRADSEALYDRLGEVGFLAFVHRGERRGRAQFEAHRDYFERAGNQRERAMFEGILVDERRHERYTRELLVELAGGEREAALALRRAGRWEAWRIWRRAGRALSGRLYGLLMVGLWLACAPIGLALRAVPRRRGWRLPDDRTPRP